jgi:hypothetical protein
MKPHFRAPMITPDDFDPEVAAAPEEFMFAHVPADPNRPAPGNDTILRKARVDPARPRPSLTRLLLKAEGRLWSRSR